MRDFEIAIPSDCVASEEQKSNHQALMLMQKVLKAKITPSRELEFEHTKTIFRQSFKHIASRAKEDDDLAPEIAQAREIELC
jgi:hypothetical protein